MAPRPADIIDPISATEDGSDRLVAHAAELGASILVRGKMINRARQVTLCGRAAWTCLEQGGVNTEFSILRAGGQLTFTKTVPGCLRPRLGRRAVFSCLVRRRTMRILLPYNTPSRISIGLW